MESCSLVQSEAATSVGVPSTNKSNAAPVRRVQLRAKHWCITLNNYNDSDCLRFNQPTQFDYAICGIERGKDGTPHLQGYVVYKQRVVLSRLQRDFPRGHFEIAKGTPLQNKTYCSKEMDFTEYGDLPLTGSQATSRNWQEAKEFAIAGKLDDIDPEVYIKYIKNLEHIQARHRPRLESNVSLDNEWHWGPTGKFL